MRGLELIVDEHTRRIIWTGPHCASRHVHKSLCVLPNVYWVIGPSPRGHCKFFDHHTTTRATEHDDCRTFAVVREPRGRIEGLYRHFCNWQRHRLRRGDAPCNVWQPDFESFMLKVADDDHSHGLVWLYRFTLARWLGDVKPDELIYFSNLSKTIDRLYPNAPLLPPYPKSAADAINWSKPARDAFDKWAAPDYARFRFPA